MAQVFHHKLERSTFLSEVRFTLLWVLFQSWQTLSSDKAPESLQNGC